MAVDQELQHVCQLHYNNTWICYCINSSDDPNPGGRRDFNNTVRTVTFLPNSGAGAEQIVRFPVYDDDIDEDPEGFIIVLDVDSMRTNVDVAFTNGLRTALGRINDDDRKSLHMQLSHIITMFSLL